MMDASSKANVRRIRQIGIANINNTQEVEEIFEFKTKKWRAARDSSC